MLDEIYGKFEEVTANGTYTHRLRIERRFRKLFLAPILNNLIRCRAWARSLSSRRQSAIAGVVP